ncbi:MAG: accessory factor UbiK family protein [Pseudomonadota bacterium]|nr:accessory factor UbiK family protein [Pseudomonadota bacterium]
MNRQENLVNRILDLMQERLPQDLGELGQDLRHNLSTVIKESLARMDLVTQEEFEVQTKVLARTRQRLEDLEQQVAALEQQRSPSPKTDNPVSD